MIQQSSEELNWIGVLSGLMLFLSTVFVFSNALILGVFVLLGLNAFRTSVSYRAVDLLPLAFATVAFANILFHIDEFDAVRHASSVAVVFIPVVALFARSLPRGTWTVFILLVSLEVFVGLFEALIGQVALFDRQLAQEGQSLVVTSELFYQRRVFGLSGNSSIFASKIFVCILLLAYGQARQYRSFFIAIMALGLILTFNRTAIFSSMIVFMLFLSDWARKRPLNLALFTVILVAGAALIVLSIDELINQLTRGSGAVSYSELSRLYYLGQALNTFTESPLFGNGSLTWRVEDPITGLAQHAHNSIVMLFVTHGLLPSLLLVGYVLTNVRTDNWRILCGIGMFSMAQYFVFWNLSVADLMMYWLLADSAKS